jgi:hypothetical protein
LLEAFVGGHRESLLLHGSINGRGLLPVDLFQRSPNKTALELLTTVGDRSLRFALHCLSV